jgi:transcriptional regulator with XRE-family HTH domain
MTAGKGAIMGHAFDPSREDRDALEFQRRIGANIRFWRQDRAFTALEFAQRCRTTVAAIARMETGEEMPSLEFLWLASQVLRVPCLVLTDQRDQRFAA